MPRTGAHPLDSPLTNRVDVRTYYVEFLIEIRFWEIGVSPRPCSRVGFPRRDALGVCVAEAPFRAIVARRGGRAFYRGSRGPGCIMPRVWEIAAQLAWRTNGLERSPSSG